MWNEPQDTCNKKAGLGVSVCARSQMREALYTSELHQQGIYLPLTSFKATSGDVRKHCLDTEHPGH